MWAVEPPQDRDYSSHRQRAHSHSPPTPSIHSRSIDLFLDVLAQAAEREKGMAMRFRPTSPPSHIRTNLHAWCHVVSTCDRRRGIAIQSWEGKKKKQQSEGWRDSWASERLSLGNGEFYAPSSLSLPVNRLSASSSHRLIAMPLRMPR